MHEYTNTYIYDYTYIDIYIYLVLYIYIYIIHVHAFPDQERGLHNLQHVAMAASWNIQRLALYHSGRAEAVAGHVVDVV